MVPLADDTSTNVFPELMTGAVPDCSTSASKERAGVFETTPKVEGSYARVHNLFPLSVEQMTWPSLTSSVIGTWIAIADAALNV